MHLRKSIRCDIATTSTCYCIPSLTLPSIPTQSTHRWAKLHISYVTHSSSSVSHNPISNWKPDFTQLRKMKILRLSGVGLGRCPEGLGMMDKLEIVDFSDNDIPVLDQAVAGLFKLKYLDMKGNRIQVRGVFRRRRGG